MYGAQELVVNGRQSRSCCRDGESPRSMQGNFLAKPASWAIAFPMHPCMSLRLKPGRGCLLFPCDNNGGGGGGGNKILQSSFVRSHSY